MTNLSELDYQLLEKELDKVKMRVFMGNNAAFLGPLMCKMDFHWDTSVPTAATNGLKIIWNPHYFQALHMEGRISILVHELWHAGLMHCIRRGERDPQIWNFACDTVIDNMMHLEGYCVDESLFPRELFPEGGKTFVDHQTYGTMSAEEIYDMMIQNRPPAPSPRSGDIREPGEGDDAGNAQVVLNNVISAFHQAKMAGKTAGKLPGDLEETINKFLHPKLPWNKILYNFFTELTGEDYSWARPNRRYQDVYLPSLQPQEEGLMHIMVFQDVSGSISTKDSVVFNSELKHIWDTFRPKKLTSVQFDTKIQKVDVFEEGDEFEWIDIVGRGGTSLVCVRDHIIKENPSAVVVFSDLYCEPMEPLPIDRDVPIIWIALDNRSAQVHQGQLVHLRS